MSYIDKVFAIVFMGYGVTELCYVSLPLGLLACIPAIVVSVKISRLGEGKPRK